MCHAQREPLYDPGQKEPPPGFLSLDLANIEVAFKDSSVYTTFHDFTDQLSVPKLVTSRRSHKPPCRRCSNRMLFLQARNYPEIPSLLHGAPDSFCSLILCCITTGDVLAATVLQDCFTEAFWFSLSRGTHVSFSTMPIGISFTQSFMIVTTTWWLRYLSANVLRQCEQSVLTDN